MTALQQVVDVLDALPTTAFVVLDQGQVVLDHGATTAPSFLASARKSVLSVLYGPAVADGTIQLGATLDELGINDIGGLLPQERRATVRDLLTSSSGVYHPPATVAGPERDGPARGSQPPAALFHYNNWDFNALGTIYERCTGRSVFDALAEDLAAPLGFQDFDPGRQRLLGRADVSEHLAHHFFLSARDLGRLGTMMVQGGRWDGRPVVPASWVAESTSVQVDRGVGVQLDYGYLWWLPRLLGRGSFLAIGHFGQYLLCVPPGLVIVHLRAVPDDVVLAHPGCGAAGPDRPGGSAAVHEGGSGGAGRAAALTALELPRPYNASPSCGSAWTCTATPRWSAEWFQQRYVVTVAGAALTEDRHV